MPRPQVWSMHPCLSRRNCRSYGRVHLPVARQCNISCRYCDRKFCAQENRPGVSRRLLSPSAALAWLQEWVARDGRLRVVGLAGPGEPLANAATWETMALVRQRYPELFLCLSTNGLLLTEAMPQLVDLGLDALTVTVNAVDPSLGAAIYAGAHYRGVVYRGEEAAALLREKQEAGIRQARAAGMAIKVNSVLPPGLNDTHLPAVARAVKEWGADIFNIIPLLPRGKMATWRPPTRAELTTARRQVADILPQITHCNRCRADAVGLLKEEGITCTGA